MGKAGKVGSYLMPNYQSYHSAPEVLTVEDLHTIFREVSFLLAVRKRLGILWYWDVKTYNCFNIIDLAMLQS